MQRTSTSKDIIRFLRDHEIPPDDIEKAFEDEIDTLAVTRFRLCVSILAILLILSLIIDFFLGRSFFMTAPVSLLLSMAGSLIFFGLLTLVPQFRKSCYAFTLMMVFFLGGMLTLTHVHFTLPPLDLVALFALPLIIIGLLMPWGGKGMAGVCVSLYLFYPLALRLSPVSIEPGIALRSFLYLSLYVVIALIAAYMNQKMRYKAFALKAKIEGENTLLQDYQTRLKRANERLENLAVRDKLTGVYNRTHMTEWLNNGLYKDKACQQLFTIIMFDVDGFKTVNDRIGHQQGDSTLQAVSRVAFNSLPEPFLMFRYGGDEFCIILPGVPLAAGIRFSENIRLRVEKDPDLLVLLPDGGELNITVSMGVSAASAAISLDMEFLIKWVDNAMLESKRQGRNCIHVFDPEERQIKSLQEWRNGKKA